VGDRQGRSEWGARGGSPPPQLPKNRRGVGKIKACRFFHEKPTGLHFADSTDFADSDFLARARERKMKYRKLSGSHY